MATVHVRAQVGKSELLDAQESLRHLLQLEGDDEIDVSPSLLDLLHALDAAIARAVEAVPERPATPLSDMPLTIATRIAGGGIGSPGEKLGD